MFERVDPPPDAEAAERWFVAHVLVSRALLAAVLTWWITEPEPATPQPPWVPVCCSCGWDDAPVLEPPRPPRGAPGCPRVGRAPTAGCAQGCHGPR
jgi:hypothetical protein